MKNILLVVPATLVAVPAFAAPIISNADAIASTTVRTGNVNTSQSFLNVRGDANEPTGANRASYGVLEFQFAARLGQANDLGNIAGLTLNLFESRFAGTEDSGTFDIWLTDNSSVDITSTGPLRFDRTSLPTGIDFNVFTGNFWSVGNYFFEGGTSTALNKAVSFDLSVSGASESYLLGQLNAGSKFRLVLTPRTSGSEDSGFAGATNSTVANRPDLTIQAEVVPEPATMLALAAGLGALGLRRRNRR